MTIVRFLGGPLHGEQRTFEGEIQVSFLVQIDSDDSRMAAYVYYRPTGDYVIASYLNVAKAA